MVVGVVVVGVVVGRGGGGGDRGGGRVGKGGGGGGGGKEFKPMVLWCIPNTYLMVRGTPELPRTDAMASFLLVLQLHHIAMCKADNSGDMMPEKDVAEVMEQAAHGNLGRLISSNINSQETISWFTYNDNNGYPANGSTGNTTYHM